MSPGSYDSNVMTSPLQEAENATPAAALPLGGDFVHLGRGLCMSGLQTGDVPIKSMRSPTHAPPTTHTEATAGPQQMRLASGRPMSPARGEPLQAHAQIPASLTQRQGDRGRPSAALALLLPSLFIHYLSQVRVCVCQTLCSVPGLETSHAGPAPVLLPHSAPTEPSPQNADVTHIP